MRFHGLRVVALIVAAASVVFATTSLALAQVNCEPGHKFTPQDHEQIVAAIVRHASEVANNIDHRELTRNNRDGQILRAASRVREMPTNIKACIQELLKQTKASPAAQEKAVLEKYPDVAKLMDRIGQVKSIGDLERLIQEEIAAAEKRGEKNVQTALNGAKQVLESGKNTIYSSRLYRNAAERYGSPNPVVIAEHMALVLAKHDVSGAIIGGLWGALFGPEGIIATACADAIKESALGVVEIFSELWFA